MILILLDNALAYTPAGGQVTLRLRREDSDAALDVLGLSVSDYFGNAPYGVPLPYHYLRLEEWNDLFRRFNLTAINCSTWKYHFLEPCKHVVVKLQRANLPVTG